MVAWALTLTIFSSLASSAWAKSIVSQLCPVPPSALADSIPASATTFITPTTSPSFVGLGVGVQNYTCTSGAFASIGAVAKVFDISCLFSTSEFDVVQEDVFERWNVTGANEFKAVKQAIHTVPTFLGDHFFIANPAGTGAAVPKFDFTSGILKGNTDAFVVAAKAVGISSPDGPANIDWLTLNATAGKLASQVFRVNTVAGQPPSSCSGSGTISVKYTAKYYFYGSTL